MVSSYGGVGWGREAGMRGVAAVAVTVVVVVAVVAVVVGAGYVGRRVGCTGVGAQVSDGEGDAVG